jgi:tryptophan synthase alpha subunit
MNDIDTKLIEIRNNQRLAIMTHVIVGYPSLEKTVSIVKTMEQSGVDFVELQIPFSDPIADGPVIMHACEEALARGTKVADAFDVVKQLSSEVSIPRLFMAYFNTVFTYGVEKFCNDAKNVGVSGLIVPDMPIEEEDNEQLAYFAKKNNLYLIRVIAPVTTNRRLVKNARVSEGFVYCSARQGTTGIRNELDPRLSDYLHNVKAYFSCPLAVGFGISQKKHLEMLQSHADIAVIGSAIVSIIGKSEHEDIEKKVARFLKSLGVKSKK